MNDTLSQKCFFGRDIWAAGLEKGEIIAPKRKCETFNDISLLLLFLTYGVNIYFKLLE